jgi:hypothetical protein
MDHAVAALRALGGVAALLGLLAMHGLATHGSAHHARSAEATPLVSTGHHAATPARESSMPMVGTSQDGGDLPGLLGLSALCLAVLMAGVGLAMGRRSGVAVTLERGRSARAGRAPRARRDRDPPCLIALSIQRC